VTGNSPELDTTVPHSARVWNYWLGGTDNYPADQLVGDQVMAMFPDIIRLARADRAFLGRAVKYLVAGAGILPLSAARLDSDRPGTCKPRCLPHICKAAPA